MSEHREAHRVVLIGIDGMDAEFVQQHLHELPNFRRVQERGFGGGARSVFPTDSIPAWITIFTGIPPVEHGFLDAIDYFKKDHKDFGVDTKIFRGRTVWDVASEAGRRCCVINPFLAYPPWDINGVMCSGPVFVADEQVLSTPPEVAQRHGMPDMGGIVDFPTKETLARFCEESRKYTTDQHEFSMKLLKQEGPWDFFFSTYLTLDRVQHFLWRYHDAGDPTHPEGNPYRSVVMDFYKLFDRLLGDYLDAVGDEMDVMVVADHGHGRRCTEVVNVNEFLRRQGWLHSKADGKNPLNPRRVLQRAKTRTMEILDRFDLTDQTYRIAKLLPQTRKLKKAEFLVDESKCLVYTPYFAGTNPCGGVSIGRGELARRGEDYDRLRTRVAEALRALRDPRDGSEIFRWVLPREEFLGQGAAIDRFPDILFLMNSGYGTGWDLYGDLVAVNPTHRKISGGHKVDGAFFSTFHPGRLAWSEQERYALTDIAPLLLHRMGLPVASWMQAAAGLARKGA